MKLTEWERLAVELALEKAIEAKHLDHKAANNLLKKIYDCKEIKLVSH